MPPQCSQQAPAAEAVSPKMEKLALLPFDLRLKRVLPGSFLLFVRLGPLSCPLSGPLRSCPKFQSKRPQPLRLRPISVALSLPLRLRRVSVALSLQLRLRRISVGSFLHFVLLTNMPYSPLCSLVRRLGIFR